MIIATFGPTTGWVGKKITREGDAFVLEDHGPITAADVMEYDRKGQLIWANDGTRAWVGSKVGSKPASAVSSPTNAPAQPEVSLWRSVVGLGLFAIVIILGVYACGGCGCGPGGSLTSDQAVERLMNTSTNGKGVWGQMPGTSLEMIAIRDGAGYLVQSRMDSTSSWSGGTSYSSAEQAVSAMVTGAQIEEFKPWP